MNLLNLIATGIKPIEQGNSVKGSSVLNNAEATTALLYSLLSTIVMLLKVFGVDPQIGDTELHTIANGWTATAGLVYGFYRIVTNPTAGVKVK